VVAAGIVGNWVVLSSFGIGLVTDGSGGGRHGSFAFAVGCMQADAGNSSTPLGRLACKTVGFGFSFLY